MIDSAGDISMSEGEPLVLKEVLFLNPFPPDVLTPEGEFTYGTVARLREWLDPNPPEALENAGQ